NRKLFEFLLLEFAQCHFILSDVNVDFRAEDHPEDVMTEYERKFVDLNQPIYRAVWTKLSK
ncbi:MAG: tRNA (guanosine(46)-N7)-methyltransferase TrmB, partial [Erysipelotrichaceae bacterium]|nr:tRNA (guanosine(46)-N7)-methyltransferase TrmB [Erysipelotrichaceae bacterium]